MRDGLLCVCVHYGPREVVELTLGEKAGKLGTMQSHNWNTCGQTLCCRAVFGHFAVKTPPEKEKKKCEYIRCRLMKSHTETGLLWFY